MHSQIKWITEGYILECTVGQEIGIVQSGEISKELTLILSTAKSKVHILFNIAEMQQSEINLTLLSTVLLPLLYYPACGWVILYGIEQEANQLFDLSITRTYRTRFRTALTQEEALELLAGKDRRGIVEQPKTTSLQNEGHTQQN